MSFLLSNVLHLITSQKSDIILSLVLKSDIILSLVLKSDIILSLVLKSDISIIIPENY
jgi:hypothetical protein